MDLDDPPPMLLQLIGGPEVTDRDHRMVERVLTTAAHGIEQLTGHRTDTLQVYLARDWDPMIDMFARARDVSRRQAEADWPELSANGKGGRGRLFLLVGTDGGPLAYRDNELITLVAHEYVHALQYANRRGSGTDTTVGWEGPNWLLEGTAEYVTQRYNHLRIRQNRRCHPGCPDDRFERRLASSRAEIGRWDLVVHLGELEMRATEHQNDPSVLLAVDELARDAGLPALLDYYRLAAQTGDWHDAFSQAFGRTPAEFYAYFDRLQATW